MHADSDWYALSITETLRHLQSAPSGLSTTEATQRLTAYGANTLPTAHRVSAWSLLLAQCKNILIIILLIAVGLSAFLGHSLEAIAIAIIVLFAVLLGFFQEYRAEQAIEALRQMASPMATVLRDGEEIAVPARDLVPGDVMLLRAGDKVPADGRLLDAINLQVEEAVLPGEPVPVEKHTAPLTSGRLAVGDRKNMVYSGTAVAYGRGRAVVVATALHTEFGRIAQLLQPVLELAKWVIRRWQRD